MPAQPAAPAPPPAVLTYTDAAYYLGLPSVGALRNMVYRRCGPPSIAYGKRDRRFLVAEMDRWLAAKAAGAQLRRTATGAGSPAVVQSRRGRPTKLEQAARRVGKP